MSDLGVRSHRHPLPAGLPSPAAGPRPRSEAEAADLLFRLLRTLILLATWNWVFVSVLLGMIRGVGAPVCAVVGVLGAGYCLAGLTVLARGHRRRMVTRFDTPVPPSRRALPLKLRIPVAALVASQAVALVLLGAFWG